MIKELVEEGMRLENKERSKDHKFKKHWSPTDAGKCRRRLWYDWKEFPREDLTTKQLGIFAIGNITHEYLEEITSNTIASELRVEQDWRGFPFAGYVDSLIQTPEGLVIVDWKTIKDNGVRFIESEAKIKHQKQVNLYMDCLGLNKGAVIYWNKAYGTLTEHKIKPNSELLDEVEALFTDVQNHLDSDELPDEKYNPSKNWMCRYCPYSEYCKTDEDSVIKE